jgi:succinyl-diaminopimelate desuccinylase
VDIDTLALAQALISRRSVTPEDAGCLDLVAQYLEPIGFACERMDSNGVSNLWARHGTAAPLVCLAGHTDVVPTGPIDQWTSDPFTPAIREGMLYGRGASDMKTSIAAFVVAADAFVRKPRTKKGRRPMERSRSCGRSLSAATNPTTASSANRLRSGARAT